jgi:hypothetical protein
MPRLNSTLRSETCQTEQRADSSHTHPASNDASCQAGYPTRAQLYALAKFIEANAARKLRVGWRQAFVECVERGRLRTFVSDGEASVLTECVRQQGTSHFVCQLRSSRVLEALTRPLQTDCRDEGTRESPIRVDTS